MHCIGIEHVADTVEPVPGSTEPSVTDEHSSDMKSRTDADTEAQSSASPHLLSR